MVDLNGHEAGNGGHSQRTPTADRDSSTRKEKVRFLGLDVHAETIAVAVAEPDGEVRSLGTIANREESIRKLVKKLGPADKLRACYESNIASYIIAHKRCNVIFPSGHWLNCISTESTISLSRGKYRLCRLCRRVSFQTRPIGLRSGE
jgi:hypothetical protein